MRTGDEIWNILEEDFFKLSSPQEKVKFILRYAILAPSTHNSQPWKFKVSNGGVRIFIDPQRRLPQADPHGRDLFISLGCLLENLVLAARHFGIFEKLDYNLEDEPNLVAEVRFQWEGEAGRNAEQEKLFEAITKRVNVRGKFETKTVPEEILTSLSGLKEGGISLQLVQEKNHIDRLSSLTAHGLRLAHARPAFRQEISQWINSSFSKRLEGLHGYSLKAPAFLSLFLARLVRNFNLSRGLAKITYQSMSSAPLIAVISAQENNPLTWLQVGRLAERAMLALQSQEVRTSIFVASIEMGDLFREVQKILGLTEHPQFLFCAGYMSGAHRHSRRYGVEEKLV